MDSFERAQTWRASLEAMYAEGSDEPTQLMVGGLLSSESRGAAVSLSLPAELWEEPTPEGLEAWLMLSGAVAACPSGLSAELYRAVERQSAWVSRYPESLSALSDYAGSLIAVFDWPAEHPARALAETVEEATVLAEVNIPEGLVQAALGRLRPRVFGAPLAVLRRLAGPGLQSFVDKVSAQPERAAAQDSRLGEYPMYSLSVDEVRDEEVVLLMASGGVAAWVGWAGPGAPPVEVRWLETGRALVPSGETLPGSWLWVLDTPERGESKLELVWRDRTWTVEFG